MLDHVSSPQNATLTLVWEPVVWFGGLRGEQPRGIGPLRRPLRAATAAAVLNARATSFCSYTECVAALVALRTSRLTALIRSRKILDRREVAHAFA
ncbi:MAG TPA: hypothetical protein VF456_22470 [Vicinamibacterales bacterium]